MVKIIITGALGQLGLALTQLLEDNTEYEVYLTDTSESEDGRVKTLDITDVDAVDKLMDKIKPGIIINCAALTAVDLCESEQELAYQVNAIGPKNLAIAADSIGALLVHISTDYVYDGQASTPYREEAKTNPISVYGRTKLDGEELVKKHCKKCMILRTAWVYGEGKNFVKTMLRLHDSGKQIRVVEDQYGTPTSALELARVILAIMKTREYGVYHATCEGSTSWYEFALEIFKQAGRKAEVLPIPSSEYSTPARRPGYSVLDNKALRERHGYIMKEWKEALLEYMKETEE